MQIRNMGKRKENSHVIQSPKGNHCEHRCVCSSELLGGDFFEKKKKREKQASLYATFEGELVKTVFGGQLCRVFEN